jgi:RNA polymerase sigma-70 factor (ECF subfamily)
VERPVSPFADAAQHVADASLVQVIRRCARREPEALRELYEQEAPRLMAWLLQMLDDPRAAGHALSACYQRVWREAARFTPKLCPPEVWLRGMARAVAIDTLCRQRATIARDDLDILLQLVDATAGTSEEDLPSGDAPRRALRLAYVSGADVTQLAGALGRPAAQVRAELHAGLFALLQPADSSPDGIREELLAGLFVLGVQNLRVRRRYAAYLQRQPAARRQLLQWEARLAELADDPPPVRPDDAQWKQIASQLQNARGGQTARAPSRWLWVAALMLASAMAWALLRSVR